MTSERSRRDIPAGLVFARRRLAQTTTTAIDRRSLAHPLVHSFKIYLSSIGCDRSLRESPWLVARHRCNLLTRDDVSNIIFLFITAVARAVAISISVPSAFLPRGERERERVISIEYLRKRLKMFHLTIFPRRRVFRSVASIGANSHRISRRCSDT